MRLSQTKTTTEKTKTEKGKSAVRAGGWLVETVARFMVGYIVLTNFNHMVAIAVGVYFTGTAAILLVIHFFKAYVK